MISNPTEKLLKARNTEGIKQLTRYLPTSRTEAVNGAILSDNDCADHSNYC